MLLALLGAGVLTGCGGQGWQDTAGSTTTTPAADTPAAQGTAARGTAATSSAPRPSTRSAAAPRSAAVDTDSVQTDPPVTAVDATVVLTYAGWNTGSRVLEASAFAQGHVDAGATCRLTASRSGAATVTGTPTPATPGPSSTDCGPLTLRLPSPASGTWEVSVVYTAKGAHLTSNTTEVQVP